MLEEKENNLKNEFIYVLYLFFFGSLIGGIMESFYVFLLYGNFNIGGFLHGPWRPIYGFGALILYFITRRVRGSNLEIFLCCTLLCSLFEYTSSYILELIFKRTWWDYSGNLLNFNGRICLFTSLIWGVLGLIFLKYIEPFLLKIYNNIEYSKMKILITGFSSLFIIDTIVSFLSNIK